MRTGFQKTIPALLTAALAAVFATSAAAQYGQLEWTNTGELKRNVFTGHQLTPVSEGGITGAASPRILYCPSEASSAAYQQAIGQAVDNNLGLAPGTTVVDYFDTRTATPDVATLQTYDAVYTWANYAYSNNVAFGDNLAAYCDSGGVVILGVFCTYTSGNYLAGAIMTSQYCPVVSPAGNNHFSSSTAPQAPQTDCIWNGVVGVTCTYRDYLVLQGGGQDSGPTSYYTDGEISAAWQNGPVAGAVVYNNGAGAVQLGGTGNWAQLTANSYTCFSGPQPCTEDPGTGVNPKGFTCITNPVAGSLWRLGIDMTPTAGVSSLFAAIALGTGQTVIPLFGYELLILPPYVTQTGSSAGTTVFSNLVPAGLSGKTFYLQGARVEADAASNPVIVLLNGITAIIG